MRTLIRHASRAAAAFDEAEAKGTPLAMTPVAPPQRVRRRMPMDLSIIAFPR